MNTKQGLTTFLETSGRDKLYGVLSLSTSKRLLIPAGLSISAGSLFLFVLFRLPSWSFSLVLLAALAVAVTPSLNSKDISFRLVTFLVLLAVCDFVKRLTFLTPSQAPWSQYVTFLFPYVYYCTFILVPFCLSNRRRSISRAGVVLGLYILVALLNTWLSKDFSFLSRLTASMLLIVPWTMFYVSAAHSESLHRSARALVICGLISAVYALLQVAFGPTIIEVRWAEAVGDFSIGAGRLISSLESNSFGGEIWRVSGLQPDALTFGLLMITALASCHVLRYERRMHSGLAYCASGVLLAAMAACLIRTIWISCLAFVSFGYLAYRLRFLLRPRVFVLLLASVFVISDFSSAYLRDRTEMVASVDNPYINRAMLLGTVAARKDSLKHFGEMVPERLFFGSGYAASSWIGGKFGENEERQRAPLALMSHNVILELLWYVGLPGIVLFVILLCEISRCAFLAISRAAPDRRKTLVVLIGYVVGMFVSGLGNGGVFLSFYFFYFSGVLVGNGTAPGQVRHGPFTPAVGCTGA